MTRDYLVELLKAYWFAPPVALWRAVELRAASDACRDAERPLLDLGCGDGLIGEILFPTPGGVDVGLDPWIDQLRQAAASDTYRHIDQANGKALPYPDRSFATVFSNSVLEHVVDVEPVLHEVARVLRPAGRFVFTVPSDAFRGMLDGYARRLAAGDPEGAEAYAARVDERLEHRHYHTPETWRQCLSEAGLTLIEATYYMPEPAERFWDRMNGRYGIGRRRSTWNLLASPRLRPLGYQRLLRRIVVKRLSNRWRPYYDMDVRSDNKGGGLLIVAQR
jgi:SAM-dependent methyltransferase